MQNKLIIKLAVLLLTVLTLGLASSCKEIKKPEDVDVKDIQIRSFSLSSKKVPQLSNYFFSIDQRTSKIYNVKPITFGLALDSTAFIIGKGPSAFSIELSKDGVEYKLWKVTDSIFLKDVKRLFLKVNTQEKDMEKIYTLHINQYEWDPTSTDWKVLPGATVPASNPGGLQKVLCSKEKAMLYRSHLGLNKLYIADRKSPILWTQTSLNGLNEELKSITQNGDKAWAISVSGKIYESSNYTDWAPVAINTEVVALLGSLVDKGESKLALLLNDAKEGMIFATYSKGVLQRFEKAPAGFPVEKFVSFNYEAYNKQGLRLLGGIGKDGTGNRSVWATSNGEDWMESSSQAQSPIPASTAQGTHAYTPGDKQHYYYNWETVEIENGREVRLMVCHSKDGGQTWQKGDPGLMLPSTELFGTRTGLLSAFGGETYNIYLFGGVNSEGIYPTDIWVGSLKLNESR